MRVEALFDSMGELSALTRLCAEAQREIPSVQQLIDQLFAEHALVELEGWTDSRVRAWLGSRMDADFSRGHIVNLRGFLLSRTEVLLGSIRLALPAEGVP